MEKKVHAAPQWDPKVWTRTLTCVLQEPVTVHQAAHRKRGGGTLQLLAFLDTDENSPKIIKKVIRIVDSFSMVKFECLDQFW